MTKLSDKVRIVSSDGEVIREADQPDIPEEESIIDRITDMLPIGKKERSSDVESSHKGDGSADEEDEDSLIDKIKNMLPVGKSSDPVETQENDELVPQFPDHDGSAGSDDPEGSDGVPQDQRKLYIAGVVGLVVLMIVSFVWFISSSKVDDVEVVPEEVTSEEVSYILEGDTDSFQTLVESVGSDVNAEEQSNGIQIDVPEEKEELENRIYELEDEVLTLEEENSRLIFENDKLEGENKGLWDRVNNAEERLEELEAGEGE